MSGPRDLNLDVAKVRVVSPPLPACLPSFLPHNDVVDLLSQRCEANDDDVNQMKFQN
jgi:hypothetical protein